MYFLLLAEVLYAPEELKGVLLPKVKNWKLLDLVQQSRQLSQEWKCFTKVYLPNSTGPSRGRGQCWIIIKRS